MARVRGYGGVVLLGLLYIPEIPQDSRTLCKVRGLRN